MKPSILLTKVRDILGEDSAEMKECYASLATEDVRAAVALWTALSHVLVTLLQLVV